MISLLFNRDDAIRAHSGTEGTTDAFFLILHKRGGIALLIQLVFRNSKTFLGASVYTQATTLTHICVKSYFSQFTFSS